MFGRIYVPISSFIIMYKNAGRYSYVILDLSGIDINNDVATCFNKTLSNMCSCYNSTNYFKYVFPDGNITV